MENESSNIRQALPPEQIAAKAAILAECERLAGAGITFVTVHFDGAGDEGLSEDIKCYATENYAYEESEAQENNFPNLQEHFETLVPYGYENGCGGFGDIILNVKTRKITVERNDRFEDYGPRRTRCKHGSPVEARREPRQKIWRQGRRLLGDPQLV